MTNYTFNIIGAGAVGHLWNSFLLHHGFDCKLYARENKPARQYEVVSPQGNFQQSFEYCTLAKWRDSDVILVCVKAHQLAVLCQQLSKIQPKCCRMILMMNGLGLVEVVQDYFPQMQVIHAYVTHGVYLESKRIIHSGNGKTVLGNLNSDYSQQQFASLVKQLNSILPTVSWNTHHQQAMRLKLVINAIINPLTAISGQRNGRILVNRHLNAEASALLSELQPIISELLPELTIGQVKQQIESVALDTGNNFSSMLQDVQTGKPTEIDFINGYLERLAKKRDISLPKNSDYIHQIKELSQQF